MKGRIGAFLRSYHLRHHYEDEHTAYGVSTPLWDYLLRTVPHYLMDVEKVPDLDHKKGKKSSAVNA
jgi:sterol desaturase/sphingolipid hydroxylase (fatty acid hydroxylase superfamily)